MAYREDRQVAGRLRGSEESSTLFCAVTNLVSGSRLCAVAGLETSEGACGQLASTVDLRIHAGRFQGGMEPFYI